MKKFGFTLAEVLIALAIVGVVAAMTIPTLSSNTKEQTNEAKEKVCVSDLESAFTMMMVQENATELAETKIWASNATAIDELGKYLKITSISSFSDGSCPDSYVCFETKKKAHVAFTKGTDGGTIIIDVNGSSKPNTDGVDKMTYTLDSNGLMTKN